MLAKEMVKFKSEKPDAVVLTEGWEGIPSCGRFDETLKMFKSNPDMKFVWSPIYVTNRSEKRHKCFEDKIEGVQKAAAKSKKANFKFVDMWDLASTLPMQEKTARDDKETLHVYVGGPYMKTALSRFEDAIE